MKLPTDFFDIYFETRSELDITVVGARAYAEHPSTEILMVSFSLDEKNVFNWNPYFANPGALIKLKNGIRQVKRGKKVIRAHNAEFEYWIWNLVGTRQFGWPEFSIDKFYDTMVVCCIAGFPASLENASETLDLVDKKNKSGKALINFFSKPSRKKDEKWKDPIVYKSKFFEFIEYCDDDVRAQIGIAKACPPMTLRQYQVYQLTEQMNIRGLPIDAPMARGALELVEQYKERANRQIQKITKNAIESATQNVALQKWLNDNGSPIPNMQAATIEKYLNNPKTPKLVKQVLTIRSNVSKSSTAKYKAALTYLTSKSTVHGFIKAFIARTGRWGGRGLQIQNFSKPDKDFPYWCDYNVLAKAIADVDMWFIEAIYADVMQALKAATRAMIYAPKGKKFICADYSQIEARIVMWLAGDKVGLKDFAGEGKIYEGMAADIFGVSISSIAKPSFERDVGKEVILGCGFGMGADKFIFRCVEQRGLKVTREVGVKGVKGYRTRYKRVPEAWKECERAAISAINNSGAVYTACNGKLAYKKVSHWLIVRLPSSRKLYYPYAKVVMEINNFGKEQECIYYKNWNQQAPAGRKWEDERTWGGTLFQHGVQATAMDIMANGMLNAEKRGYPALFTVHDESLAMVDENFGTVKEYEDILCELEPWAKGLPIVAEGWSDTRYKK
jgi:DNA polymerase